MDIVLKGKRLVTWIIVVTLLIDIITIAVISSLYATIGNMDYASYNLLRGIFRFILTGIIMYFLYKGHTWAKGLITVLALLSGLIAIMSLLANFNLIMFVMGSVYISIGVTLLTSNSIKNFMSYQKGEIIINEINSDNSEPELSEDQK